MNRKAILTIDIEEMGSFSTRIKLTFPDESEIPVYSSIGYSNLAKYYEDYRCMLEDCKGQFSEDSFDEDFDRVEKAFRSIYDIGQWLFDELFEDQTAAVVRYLEKYRKVSLLYLISLDLRRSVHPPVGVINIKAEDIKAILPIECLMMMGPEVKVNSLQDMITVASRILGFSFIINRVIKQPPCRLSQKQELRNTPKLPMKYFSYRGRRELRATDDELAFFKDYSEYIDLDGPWPEKDTKATVADLVQYLFKPDIRFNLISRIGGEECRFDEIHHLSCHCYADEEQSRNSFLDLTGGRFTLGSMVSHLRKHELANEGELYVEKPLVFLNACGSSRLTPNSLKSFPEYFLYTNKNCGFIGTEINIPDAFAAEFCQEFYSYLLRGSGIGEAIFMARYKMLYKQRTPLGIIYTYYGNPYLRVTKPIDHKK